MLAAATATFLLLRPHAHAGVPRAPQPARAAAGITTPVRTPWDERTVARLRADLQSALAPALAGAGAWSCAVIADDGTLLYADRASEAAVPASSQKLIVADAALNVLGGAFRFSTLLAAHQEPQAGNVAGDLWLIGSGDPSLRFGDLRSGASALRDAGIRSVGGSVVVDPSAVAGEEINPQWDASDSNEDFMTATSGISVDEDTVEFDVTGSTAGSSASISVLPNTPLVHYTGSVVSGDGDDVVIAGTAAPNDFRIYGTIPPGVRERFWLPVHGIPQYAGAVAEASLRDAGIALNGPPQTGTAPLDARILWQHRSPPVSALVKHMLVHSDNHYAEQLMRAVGGASGGAANDRDGIASELALLKRQGIATRGLHVVDGSGLARANRVSAMTLAGVLRSFESAPGGNALYPLLPRGGLDGTLKEYRFGPAAGRVRAKSGHLSGASALAGYVDTRSHGRVVFAFIVNGSPGDPDSAIVSAVDRIAER